MHYCCTLYFISHKNNNHHNHTKGYRAVVGKLDWTSKTDSEPLVTQVSGKKSCCSSISFDFTTFFFSLTHNKTYRSAHTRTKSLFILFFYFAFSMLTAFFLSLKEKASIIQQTNRKEASSTDKKAYIFFLFPDYDDQYEKGTYCNLTNKLGLLACVWWSE